MTPDIKWVEVASTAEGDFFYFDIELGTKTPLDERLLDTYVWVAGEWYGNDREGLARARFVVFPDNTMRIFSPHYDTGSEDSPKAPVTLERIQEAFASKGRIIGVGEILMTRKNNVTGRRYLTDNFLDCDAGEVDASEGQAEYVSKVLIATLGRDNFNFIHSYQAQAIVDAFMSWTSGLT